METSSADTGSSHTIRSGLTACAGDADALALAAGELVRVAPGVLGQQADDIEELAHALLARGLVADLVHVERLGEDLAHRHARVERGIGILEDDLHVAAHPPQVALAEVGDLLALEAHRAPGRVHQAEHEAAGRRLAAARFAHQRQGLAAGDLEAHVLDGAHHADQPAADDAGGDGEMLYEAVDRQDRDVAHAATPLARSSTGAFQQATR
jgi:hypothetical protein